MLSSIMALFQLPYMFLTLNEIQDAEIALLRVHSENEIQCGIMSIDQLCTLPPLRNDAFQVVAERIRPLCHLLEDAVDDAFLGFFSHLFGRNQESKPIHQISVPRSGWPSMPWE